MRNIINMKKSVIMVASLAALIAGGISVAQAAPATVTRTDGCGLLDGNGVPQFATDAKMTTTQSANDNATFQCRADVTPADSGGAAHFDFDSTGFKCAIPNPESFTDHMTEHWEETVSASGEATLTCHLP
jgi:hypothetical protein